MEKKGWTGGGWAGRKEGQESNKVRTKRKEGQERQKEINN